MKPGTKWCSWPGNLATKARKHETFNVFVFSRRRGRRGQMAVLIDRSTRLLVQGLTGREGTFHAKQAAAYGTTVVGGVTPGNGGTTHEGWPGFGTGRDV